MLPWVKSVLKTSQSTFKIYKKQLLGAIFLAYLVGCKDKSGGNKAPDTVANVPVETITYSGWWESEFFSVQGVKGEFTAAELENGGPQGSIGLTYAQASSPTAIFLQGRGPDGGDPTGASIGLFLAAVTDAQATVSVQYTKLANGRVVASRILPALECPTGFTPKVSEAKLANQKVPQSP